jgi:hypothetical protein
MISTTNIVHETREGHEEIRLRSMVDTGSIDNEEQQHGDEPLTVQPNISLNTKKQFDGHAIRASFPVSKQRTLALFVYVFVAAMLLFAAVALWSSTLSCKKGRVNIFFVFCLKYA